MKMCDKISFSSHDMTKKVFMPTKYMQNHKE